MAETNTVSGCNNNQEKITSFLEVLIKVCNGHRSNPINYISSLFPQLICSKNESARIGLFTVKTKTDFDKKRAKIQISHFNDARSLVIESRV